MQTEKFLDRPWIADIGWRLARMASPRKHPAVHFVSDGANWAFDWVGRYLAEGLKTRHAQPADIIAKPHGLAGQIVHFVSRYAFLDPVNRFVHLRNRSFLNWYHSDLHDPAARGLIDSLLTVASRVERVVVPCSLTAAALCQVGMLPSKIITIPIGADTIHFRPASDGLKSKIDMRRQLDMPDDAIVVGSFQKDGTGWGEGLEPKLVKGPDTLLETIARIFEKEPRLIVLLTGPARGYVKNGLAKIGVPFRHVNLHDYRDIVRHYQALDLYVISSRCEGGPKALLESWACGVPVVTTRVGMCADSVDDGVNGLMVNIEDSSGLAEGALRLIGDVSLRSRLIQAGLERVRDFDWGLIADRHFEELYRPVLADDG